MTLLVSFLLGSGNVLKAQTPICGDTCQPGPLHWEEIQLCTFTDLRLGTNPVPYVFVEIAYRIDSCHVPASIIIDDYVFVDDADYWINYYFTMPDTNPHLDPDVLDAITNNGCIYESSTPGMYVPPTLGQMKLAVKDAIEKLLDRLGNPTLGNYDVHFKGSCRSWVDLSFPTGSYFTYGRGDLPGFDTVYFSKNTIVTQPIPCNDGCCKVSYQWKMVTLSNGETISKWVAVSSATDAEASCEGQPLPDYNVYPNKIEAYLPGGGTTTGTVKSQTPCEIECKHFYSPPPTSPATSVKSDMDTKDHDLQLSAGPLPFNNYIRFMSDENISNAVIVVYDINGKKVLNASCPEKGKLNTSELKTGVYLIQVWFPDNTVKTIKAIKK